LDVRIDDNSQVVQHVGPAPTGFSQIETDRICLAANIINVAKSGKQNQKPYICSQTIQNWCSAKEAAARAPDRFFSPAPLQHQAVSTNFSVHQKELVLDKNDIPSGKLT